MFSNFCRTVFPVLLLLTAVCLAQQSPTDLPAEAQRAVARAVLMRSGAIQLASGNSYFPRLDRPAVITWPEQGRYITVGVVPPPPNFTPVKFPWTSDVIAVGQILGFPTDGFFFVPFSTLSEADTPASGGLALRLAFHEADHGYMQSQPTEMDGCHECMQAGLDYPIYDADNSARAQLEARILIAAYEKREDPAALRQLAGDLVAVRALRYQKLGPLLAGFEQMNDRNEGLAEYCGKSAIHRWRIAQPSVPAVLSAAANIGDLAAAEQRTNQDGISFLSDPEKVRRGLTREWAYHAGPPMGYILDAIRPGWLRD